MLGVDIGGTFTDFVLFNGRKLMVSKMLSTSHNPAVAVFKGIRALDVPVEQLNMVHGSTVVTNALLERKGAKVALITTKGYEDIIEIGRQSRSTLYDLFIKKGPPLVPGKRRWGVRERSTAAGTLLQKINKSDLIKIKAKLNREGIEAVAICFLFSYKNPTNEASVMNELANANIHVSASHKILPEYREYERFSTTVANAYVTPVMLKYITLLEDRLGVSSMSIMQSNGGSISTRSAKEKAVNCILSGPAGGVIGAARIAKLAGKREIITFDMGGTSTDVSLCDGDVRLTTETKIDEMPIRVPVIDIYTVGAGGGSIACIDPGGAARVGPQSAGASPGPICYGKGKSLTVTDANLFLGRINARHFLGGKMQLHVDKISAYLKPFAMKLKKSRVQAAEGIIDVVNANMERAIKVISVEKGYDIRGFTLVSFGGAGGLHACELASSLSMKGVLVPKNAGVLSALGMVVADTVKDYSKSVLLKAASGDYEMFLDLLKPLASQGMKEVLAEGVSKNKVKQECSLDMRYVGQSHELNIPFQKDFVNSFHKHHKKMFGYSNRDYGVEVVNLRTRVTGKTKKPSLRKNVSITQDNNPGHIKATKCFFKGKWHKSNIYERNKLPADFSTKGPALIVEDTSTTFLPPGFVCNVDVYENLIIQLA